MNILEAEDGRMFFDLNRDMSDGARFSLPSSPVVEAGARGAVPTVRMGETQVRSPTLEGRPVTLNIEFREPVRKRDVAPTGWGEVEADPPMSDAALEGITRDQNDELAWSRLEVKASARVVRLPASIS